MCLGSNAVSRRSKQCQARCFDNIAYATTHIAYATGYVGSGPRVHNSVDRWYAATYQERRRVVSRWRCDQHIFFAQDVYHYVSRWVFDFDSCVSHGLHTLSNMTLYNDGYRPFTTTDEDHGGIALVVTTLFGTYTVLCCTVRIFTRSTTTGPVGKDDLCCILGTVRTDTKYLEDC
jgi:hypothetical protein